MKTFPKEFEVGTFQLFMSLVRLMSKQLRNCVCNFPWGPHDNPILHLPHVACQALLKVRVRRSSRLPIWRVGFSVPALARNGSLERFQSNSLRLCCWVHSRDSVCIRLVPLHAKGTRMLKPWFHIIPALLCLATMSLAFTSFRSATLCGPSHSHRQPRARPLLTSYCRPTPHTTLSNRREPSQWVQLCHLS